MSISVNKETEIGLLPAEWQVVKLSQAAKRKTGTLDPQDHPEEVFDYYSIPAYQEGEKPVLETGANIGSRKLIVDTDMVMFGRLNPRVPKIWRVLSESERRKIASTEFIALIPKAEKTDRDYLYYLLRSNYVLPKSQELVSGSTPSRQRTDIRSFLRIPVPLPPLPEQRRIAGALRAIQEAIAAQEDVIAAARELKRSLMERLFTYGPGAEPALTKETEIGEIPRHWPLQPLGEHVSVKGGKRLPKGHSFADEITPYPYIRVTDFQDWSVDMSDLRYLTPEDRQAIERYIITVNNVYISIAGTIGVVGTIPKLLDGANLTENAARIVILEEVVLNRDYLVAYLASEKGQRQIDFRTTKTSQPKLALTRIRQIPLPLPPLSEQKKIARVLSAVNMKIAAEEQRKAALEEVFRSALEQLMTGQIRLNAEAQSRRGAESKL